MMQRTILPVLSIALFSLPALAAETALLDALDASRIVAISDGDFVSSTYSDGALAPEGAGYRDLLTVLTRGSEGWTRAEVEISNSVTAAPEILVLDPSGQWAFVAERLEGRAANASVAADLAPGSRVLAIDLSDPFAPRLAFETRVMDLPDALALSPDGRFLAVVGGIGANARIDILPFGAAGFGTPQQFPLGGLGLDDVAGPLSATNVHWHPRGDRLAVNLNRQNRVALLSFSEVEGLRLVGTPEMVGTDPFVGRFSADGRYYFTSDWGRNFEATSLEARLPDRPSTLSVLSVGEDGLSNLGSVDSGESAEGLAVSPAGGLVATVNMDGTILAGDRFSRHATVALFQLDDTGGLNGLGLYPLDGVLPEGGSFDASGRHFLATVFEGHDGAEAGKGAGLEVFAVTPESGHGSALKPLGRIPMPHGVHHVVIHP